MRGLQAIILGLGLVASAVGAESLPDPTRPADFFSQLTVQRDMDKAGISWNVTAIRISDVGSSAILNGKFVRIGDSIANARVVDIRSDAVVLEFDGRQVDVRILRTTVKKPAASGNRQQS